MNKKIITKEQLLEVISICSTKTEAAKKLGVSTDTLIKNLRQNNLTFDTSHWKAGKQMTSLRQHPEIDKDWLEINWLGTTKSIRQLAADFGVPDSLIESRITFYGLKKTFKHQLDIKKFTNLNDPHIWYIAGLFNTDGSFSKEHDTCSIELVGQDEYELLLQIKKYYNSSQPVKKYLRSLNYHSDKVETSYWQVSFAGLKQFFEQNFNISTVNKTFTTSAPKNFPTEDCAKAFIRGCLDGDGYISKDCKTVNICTASEDFIKGIGYIVELYNVPGNYSLKHGDNGDYPQYCWRTNKAKKFLTWLYSLENCFKLQRKYLRYRDICCII